MNRRRLTDLFVSSRKGGDQDELIWDERCPGLALSVRVTGKKALEGHLQVTVAGRAGCISAMPGDRACGRKAAGGAGHARRRRGQRSRSRAAGTERDSGSFADLASRYVELWAKKHNKSWKQAEALVAKHLLPRWGRMKATAITRADVRAVMARIEAPIVANQTLAAASAIFTWAVKQEIVDVNPVAGVDRNPTASRERVLSDAEIKLLWGRLDPGLKLLLLTGQRPGEVVAMQAAHIVDGFWQMPGKPVGDWPGTKNGRDHRVALSTAALDLTGTIWRRRNRTSMRPGFC